MKKYPTRMMMTTPRQAGDNAAGADDLSGLLAAGVGAGYLTSAACFAMASRASPQPTQGNKAKQN
jgi:hypothetical protein